MTSSEGAQPNAARLRDMTCGDWLSQCIAVVGELGIADLLKPGAKHVRELADATGTKPGPLYRVLRALASYGIFAEGPDDCFALTPLAELLQKSPNSLRGWAILLGIGEFHRAWEELSHTLKTGQPGFNHVFGMNFWEYLTRNPEVAAVFNEGLTAYTSQVAAAVVGAYDFSRFRRLVDVGAGHGVLMATILKANPHLHGVVFDLPHAHEGGTQTLAAAALLDRCDVVSGDFFRAVPEGGDAYLLSHVIHDWSDERALGILANCRRAMAAGATLLLVEAVIPPGNQPFFGKLLDVHMMVATDEGADRTEAQYRQLLEKSGYHLRRVVPTASDVSIIEGTPI